MAKGSQLSQLKSALSNAGITKPQPGNKRKRSGATTQQSDKIKKAAKLKEIHERLNPFDVKVTKLKHDVGGRKLKGVGGRPAASKQAGIDQRKKTLLKEYEEKGRAGGVMDRRFGENDPTVTPEERMLERFTRERQRTARGGVAFNLEDEDDLTHYGQSLSKMDDFDDAGIHLSDEEEDAPGQIDGRTVKSVHFGGFDEEEEGDEDEEPERKKSKAEVMAEVIAKSKEHKALRQISRQQDDDMRHQLDNELDSIRDLLFTADSSLTPLEASTLSDKTTSSDSATVFNNSGDAPVTDGRDATFDQYVRELAFEKRARPKDRTKTEEELAAEEKEKLEKAERRRQRRMQGDDDYDSEEEEAKARAKRRKLTGGDDLEDDFSEEPAALGAGLEELKLAEDDDKADDSQDEEDDSSEEDDEGEGSGDNDDEEGDTDDEDQEDDKVLAEEGEHEDLVKPSSATKKRIASEHRSKELPFTFPCPDTHDEFLEIVQDIDESDVPIVVQRIRALYHPSLAEDNKFKLQSLAGVILDHILYITALPTPRFGVLTGLLPHLAALTKSYPIPVGTHFVTKLSLMEKNFRRGISNDPLAPASRTFPGSSELALLRITGLLWPTSDMQHAVVSPARLLMGAYLALSRVRSLQDLASGLFICTLWLQYEARSRRFVPEAVTFAVNTILHLAPHPYKTAKEVPGVFPCPDLNSDLCIALRLDAKKARKAKLSARTPDLISLLAKVEEGEQEKVNLFATALQILLHFSEMYKDLDAFPELFQPILDTINSIYADQLPKDLQTRILSTRDTFGRLLKFALQSRQPLMLQAHKPIPIPTYVPQFESSGGSSYLKRRDPDTERAAASKLRREYKQERKGAIRELRKDARFLAGVQQRAQADKDKSYEERMRRVHGSMEGERAEEKRMEKEKMKMKKRAGKR